MYNLNPASAHGIAKELSLEAIKDGMIKQGENAKETANAVMDFYEEVYRRLTENKINSEQ